MNELLSEAIGTFILILFGCGVNAGISLNKSFWKCRFKIKFFSSKLENLFLTEIYFSKKG